MNTAEHTKTVIKEEYKKSILSRTLYIGRISSGIAVPGLIYFIFQDYNLADFPPVVPLWRIPALVLAAIFYLMSYTPLKKEYYPVRIIYMMYLISLMAMMCGITAIFAEHDYFDASVSAMILVTFGIFLSSVGGFRFLFPIYFLPITFFMVYLAVSFDLPRHQWLSLSNPIVTIIISLIIAGVYEKMNFREFRSNKIIMDSKEEIEASNKRLNRDMELARHIQERLVPEAPSQVNGATFYSLYKPMEEIGGDLYDFVFMEESNQVGIFISDVSGHGISAALITGMVKTLINTAGERKLQPAKLLTYMNSKISGQITGYFLTAFYGIIDTDRKVLRYARGGHNYPYLIRNNEVITLKSKGALLGLMRYVNIVEEELQLQSGDKLLFYTDGLIEAMNSSNEEFEKVLTSRLLPELSHLSVREYVTAIYNSLVEFHGSEVFEDDICIVAVDVS
jgi:serine phosphatase RsbU (regulator of sigma subunit)